MLFLRFLTLINDAVTMIQKSAMRTQMRTQVVKK
nr:MAG TPA: hypothetical protein [Caudoviricetes sp.]